MNMMWILLAVAVVTFVVIWTLCQSNPTFKYNVKFAVYYSVMSVAALIVLCLAMLSPGNPNNFRYLKPPFRLCRMLLGIDAEVRGQSNLESHSPYVLVSNHQSSLDFLGVAIVIPWRCTFLAKKELFYAGPFGLACWLCGIIFIDRQRHKSAVNTMINAAKTMKKKNQIVWVFPEGRRNHGTEFLPFKSGAFHLAVQAQVPVVPVVFSAYKFYDKKRKHLDSGRYTITALPPIPTEGMTESDVAALTDKVRSQMMSTFEQTST